MLSFYRMVKINPNLSKMLQKVKMKAIRSKRLRLVLQMASKWTNMVSRKKRWRVSKTAKSIDCAKKP